LAAAGNPTAVLDAKRLTAHALGFNDLQLALSENDAVSAAHIDNVAALMERRLTGESVARIIGEREFYGLAFGLNSATLEPRPDTELLVDLALEALPNGGSLVDLGTGTGCIPISILANRPDATGLATDINPDALGIAKTNAARHDVTQRLRFAVGSWFDAVGAERFDLVLSNPPYIASNVIETLAAEVREFDPMLALDGGPDGLEPYRIIAHKAADHLHPNGQVMVEIGYDQADAVSGLFRDAGFSNVSVHKDMAGLDRVVWAHHLGGINSKR
jgi:release factor glutamine methyltransferase